jgi:hypothetical protein
MIGAISLIGILLGGGAAYFADRIPAYRDAIETGAGLALIGGLALLGSALPSMV